MAEDEDYADFGSHFLDSMLEVEMTEEDGEIDVSQPEDNLHSNRVLPPIPTFDLETESLNDCYTNQLTPVTMVQPGPMLTIHSRELLSNILPNAKVVAAQTYPLPMTKIIPVNNFATNTPKTLTKVNLVRNPVTPSPSQKNQQTGHMIPSKAVTVTVTPKAGTGAVTVTPKSGAVTVTSKAGTVTVTPKGGTGTPKESSPKPDNDVLKKKFIQKVFKAEFIKYVFYKPDPPRNISQIGPEEMQYYKNTFSNLSNVQYCRLHCTICDNHLGCGSGVEKKLNVHNMLKVITCKPCYEFYGDGNFPCDQGDNCEIYCRWCGQGGALVCCSFCPRVFCKKCVRRNYGPPFLKSIERASDWACFCCAQKPLWPHRAICSALVEYIAFRKTKKTSYWKDTSTCCTIKRGRPEKGKIRTPTSSTNSTPPSVAVKVNSTPKDSVVVVSSNPNKRLILPLSKTLVRNDILRTSPKVADQNMSPTSSHMQVLNSINKLNSATKITNLRSFKQSNVLRSFNPTSTNKALPKLVSPQSIQTPVYHGQTLITPPASRQLAVPPLVARAAPKQAPKKPPPYVKVSVNQSSSVDINKIPTAKIPHNVQGLILRLNFPDNKVQLVRLVTEGPGCSDFFMPEFENSSVDFLEGCLEDSFKLTKILYDKLMLVREKIKSKTKITEESVYNSSVKKLHAAFEKSQELLKELNEDLRENYEEWKTSQLTDAVDVIDLSEDDSKTQKSNKGFKRYSKFKEKSKDLMENDDSDIEIIDDLGKDEIKTDKNNSSNKCKVEKSGGETSTCAQEETEVVNCNSENLYNEEEKNKEVDNESESSKDPLHIGGESEDMVENGGKSDDPLAEEKGEEEEQPNNQAEEKCEQNEEDEEEEEEGEEEDEEVVDEEEEEEERGDEEREGEGEQEGEQEGEGEGGTEQDLSNHTEESRESISFEEHTYKNEDPEDIMENSSNHDEDEDNNTNQEENNVNGIDNEDKSDDGNEIGHDESNEISNANLSTLSEEDIKEKFQIKEFSIDLVKLPNIGKKRRRSNSDSRKKFKSDSPSTTDDPSEQDINDDEEPEVRKDENEEFEEEMPEKNGGEESSEVNETNIPDHPMEVAEIP